MAADQLLGLDRQQVPVQHRRRLDDGLGQADRRQLERKTAGLEHAALDVLAVAGEARGLGEARLQILGRDVRAEVGVVVQPAHELEPTHLPLVVIGLFGPLGVDRGHGLGDRVELVRELRVVHEDRSLTREGDGEVLHGAGPSQSGEGVSLARRTYSSTVRY